MLGLLKVLRGAGGLVILRTVRFFELVWTDTVVGQGVLVVRFDWVVW